MRGSPNECRYVWSYIGMMSHTFGPLIHRQVECDDSTLKHINDRQKIFRTREICTGFIKEVYINYRRF